MLQWKTHNAWKLLIDFDQYKIVRSTIKLLGKNKEKNCHFQKPQFEFILCVSRGKTAFLIL